MKLYCLSGLGADSNFLKNLSLRNVDIVHISWLPFRKEETLAKYALRLSNMILETTDYCLLGVSFGGIIAQEIANIKPPKKLILISTIENKKELPSLFLMAGKLKMHNIFTDSTFRRSNFIIRWFAGAVSQEQRNVLKAYIEKSNPEDTRWAFQSMMNWNGVEKIERIRIHGTKDRVFPIVFEKTNYPIERGGHLMILSKAKEISKIINSEIGKAADKKK